MMSNANMKVISTDGEEFNISYDIAKQSRLLHSYFDESFDEPIKLPLVNASILKSVIDFCEHHKNDPEAEISDDDDDDDDNNNNITKKNVQELKQRKPVSEWDRAFIQRFSVRDESLFDIVTAANYLDIPILLNTICKSIIYLIKGKTSEEIREIFKIAELLNETTTTTTDSTSSNHSVTSQTKTKT
ncbi:hypothetical protein I4U23_023523 [Adineta vaga]|nr:hypothetical protein I4U23_023523 [Adineta vaga]